MIIKIVGLVCAFMFFSLIGIYQSVKLKKRKDNLNEILLFLNRLGTTIRYRRGDIVSLISDCADNVLVPLKNAEEYSEYQNIVMKLPLKKEEKGLLSKFFYQIGTMDLEGELSSINLYIEFFNEIYEKAKYDLENKSKLYRMLGIFAGRAFVVMFI